IPITNPTPIIARMMEPSRPNHVLKVAPLKVIIRENKLQNAFWRGHSSHINSQPRAQYLTI
ncbi:hypothetical protein, partial [Microcystis aeruginosa]|uniref:hypothetical protein n=1 Tax=Microcystis aeruginosa TaxID=1126 RepID=UPI001C4050AB